MTREFWNERYSQHQYVYGEAPNEFLKEQLNLISPGKIFLPAEGEGRNAIYAASIGWQVIACDYSEIAKNKALERAAALGLTSIQYTVEDLSHIVLPADEFDVVALIYVHLPIEVRRHLLQQCMKSLKPGGKIILETFSKDQLNYQSGGPKDMELLYSCQELKNDLMDMEIIRCEELITQLDEGAFHSGSAAVVRLVAVK